MSDLVRFSVSLESDLLAQFDEYIQQQKYATRSEAVRQLLRETLTAHGWTEDAEDAVATLTIVYDHHEQGDAQTADQLLPLVYHELRRFFAAAHASGSPCLGAPQKSNCRLLRRYRQSYRV
jgi:CopG family nickel-responsive transcriptional regulator